MNITKESILDDLEGYLGNQPVRIGNQAHEHLQHDVYGEMILTISQLFLDLRFGGQKTAKPDKLLLRLLERVENFMEAKDAGLWEFL